MLSLFSGNYLYLEASSHTDSTAQLISPLHSSGIYCFSAYYHMYGTDTGTLSFNVLQHGHSHTLKSFRGNLGNHWNHVRMEINIHHHFQVSIIGFNTVIYLFVQFSKLFLKQYKFFWWKNISRWRSSSFSALLITFINTGTIKERIYCFSEVFIVYFADCGGRTHGTWF